MKVEIIDPDTIASAGSDGLCFIYDKRVKDPSQRIEANSGINDLLYNQDSNKLYLSLVEGQVAEVDLRSPD